MPDAVHPKPEEMLAALQRYAHHCFREQVNTGNISKSVVLIVDGWNATKADSSCGFGSHYRRVRGQLRRAETLEQAREANHHNERRGPR